ncbi:MAG TPA: hypothetical protein VJJ80_01130 [Patescibacteria group bacterium]|nr:hypothetical protein [Patescibacteria group bacterium]
MLSSRRDKIMAGLIVILLFSAFITLAWLSKTGGFIILADVLQKGL